MPSTNMATHTHIHTCIHTYIHAYIHKRIYVCTYSAPRKLRFAQGFPMICVVHIFHRPTATSSSTSARGCRQAASQRAASAATCGQTVYVQYAELLSTPYQPPIYTYVFIYVSIVTYIYEHIIIYVYMHIYIGVDWVFIGVPRTVRETEFSWRTVLTYSTWSPYQPLIKPYICIYVYMFICIYVHKYMYI